MNTNNGSRDSVDTWIPYKILGYSNDKYILLLLYLSHIAIAQKGQQTFVLYLLLYYIYHNFNTEYGDYSFCLQRLKIFLFQFQLSSIRL